MICQNCKEVEATVLYYEWSTCYECLYDFVQNACLHEAIAQFIDNNSKMIGS